MTETEKKERKPALQQLKSVWPDLWALIRPRRGLLLLGLLLMVVNRVSGMALPASAKFFVAGHSIPGWVVSFTLMGTIIGTGTFVGHPGTSYQKGLILLLPHMLLPLVLLVVAKFIVPFYRRVVRMSEASSES